MSKLTVDFTPRHFNLPRPSFLYADPMAIPVGDVAELGESGLMEFLHPMPDFADTVPAGGDE